MGRFNTLEFISKNSYRKTETKVQMFVPGVNSGAYDKALCVYIFTKTKNWFGGSKRDFTEVKLTKEEVLQLKNECEKILELP